MIKYSHFIEEKPVARGAMPTLRAHVRTMINERGQEVLDKTPVEIPVMMTPPPSSFMEMMHALYRQQAEEQEVETFEEANNFDIPDEIGIEMTDTPYEQDFDHLEPAPETVGTSKAGTTVPSETSESVQK